MIREATFLILTREHGLQSAMQPVQSFAEFEIQRDKLTEQLGEMFDHAWLSAAYTEEGR